MADDLVFMDDASQPKIDLGTRNEPLDRDLFEASEIKMLLMTVEGYNALFSLLVTRGWGHETHAEPVFYTWDEAGEIIARIRALGETHYDVQFPCLKAEEYSDEYRLMESHLSRLGWFEV